MRLADFKIGIRLGSAFALLLVLTLAVGGIALLQIERLNQAIQTIGNSALPGVAETGNIRAQWNRFRRLESLLLSSATPQSMDALQKQAESVLDIIARSEKNYEALPHTDEELQLMQTYQRLRNTYLNDYRQLAAAARRGSDDTQTLQRMYEAAEADFAALAETAGKLTSLAQQGAEQLRRQSEQVRQSALMWTLAGMAASGVLALLLAILVTRSVVRPVHQAVDAAARMADGDLTATISARGRDELAQLMQTLERMRGNLDTLVQHVRQNADAVVQATEEISTGTSDLSSRTEEQASALQQTAASMEQLSSTVRQNADSAMQANQLAMHASQIAAQGGEVVGEVVDNMHSINESSHRIADIIGVIDSIAFQTNILALNASVEAARAGEQGRGFAVVADEVRALAQRSADAAKEIRQLINHSVENISAGGGLVDKAGQTMQEVVSAIRRVTDLVGEISAASTEQSQGVAQVSEAITQMDATTQQNATLVEQSAAAADSLRRQARELVQAVAAFRTSTYQASAASKAQAPVIGSPAASTGSTVSGSVQRDVADARPSAAPRSLRIATSQPAPARSMQQPPQRGADSDDWESF